MTEHELEHEVIAEATRLKLRLLIIPDSRRLVHGKGFPDLVIVGPRSVLFVELKDDGGRLARDQLQWQYALKAAGARHLVWRPHHWRTGEIRIELQHLAFTR